MTNKLLIIGFVILLCPLVKAQDTAMAVYPHSEWLSVKEGLSQGLVGSIIQDKQGYMWFATADGLNKYDGYNITVFRNNPKEKFSLPENSISCLAEDDYGNLWVGTAHKGLLLFDRKTEHFYPLLQPRKAESNNDGITSIQANHDKLVIRMNTDLLIYKTCQLNLKKNSPDIENQMKLLFSYNAAQSNPAYQINFNNKVNTACLPDGSLWVACKDTVFRYSILNNMNTGKAEGYSLKTIGIDSSFATFGSIAAVANNPGNIWFAWKTDIIEFDALHKKILTKIKTSLTGRLLNLSNNSFLFSDDKKLYSLNAENKKITQLDMQQGKPNNIFSYCQPCTDANGITWFGTNGYGVLKTDARKQLFTNYKTLSNNDAYSILLNESFDTLPANLKKKYDFGFNSAVQDAKEIYWICAWVKETGGLKLISYNPKSGAEQIWSLPGSNSEFARPLVYNDAKDRLWIFSNLASGKEIIYQINKQTGKQVATYTMSVDPIYNGSTFFMQLWQDAQQVFWLAAANGLYRFNPAKNEWRHWQHKDDDSSSISADWIYSVCPDPEEPERYLWLGTNGNGFDKFDMLKENTVEHYSMADGLPNNVVYGILPDSAGNLWMSTNKGLSCFTPSAKEFRNFSAEDGLLGDEFNHFDFMKLKNGALFFGGVDGFTTFNPAAVLQKQKQAPIVFTGFSISNKPVDWEKDSTVIAAPIGDAQTITLHPGQNMFTISFASLEFRSNQKKFYKYKLDGFDKDWTTPTNKNEATYTNLSPGTYTFYVTGTNSDGVWNEKGISIKVLVLPAWYQTYWFMAAVIILVAAGLYMLYRYRLQQVLKMAKLRNRIASDLHDEIGSTLSSISLYGAAAKKMVTGNEAANNILTKINANTTAMMEAMSDIVWAINTRNDGLDNLANRMRNFAVQISEAKNIELHFTENEDLPAMPLDMVQRKNMYLIFKEAVNNAAKYSGCKNLWISFISEPNILKLTIKDDGKGFEASPPIPLQKRGERGGNGMINMKNRAQEIKGELFINTQEGKGTEVILKLHMKKS